MSAGLILKLKDDAFARGFVEGVQRDAKDFGERIAELEAALCKWRDDYERLGTHSVVVPLHQLDELLIGAIQK